MLSCSIWFSAPSFWVGGGLESRCVGRVYGADGAVRLARPTSPNAIVVVSISWPSACVMRTQVTFVIYIHQECTGFPKI